MLLLLGPSFLTSHATSPIHGHSLRPLESRELLATPCRTVTVQQRRQGLSGFSSPSRRFWHEILVQSTGHITPMSTEAPHEQIQALTHYPTPLLRLRLSPSCSRNLSAPWRVEPPSRLYSTLHLPS